MKLRLYFLAALLALSCTAKTNLQAQTEAGDNSVDFNELSESFLHKIKAEEDTQEIQNILEKKFSKNSFLQDNRGNIKTRSTS